MTFRFDPDHLRGETYRVPGSATENGLPADSWTVLAELQSHEAPAVLDALAEAEVGGYTVPVKGPNTMPGRHQLYVDATRYNRAEDVLMTYLRGRTALPYGASPRTPAGPAKPHPTVDAVKRIWSIRAVRLVSEIVMYAVVFGGFLIVVYLYGAAKFPAIHDRQHSVSPGTPVIEPPRTGGPWP